MIKCSFNKNWFFYKDGCENEKIAIDLPHDAMQTEKRSIFVGSETGSFPGGKYVYLKEFYLPKEDAELDITFEFEGIYKNSQVFINNVYVGGRPYGYTGFYINATQFLKFGEMNRIKVIADNSKYPNSRWYSGSGIYRDVNIIKQQKSHIDLNGIKLTTVTASNNSVVNVKTFFTNPLDCDLKVKIDVLFNDVVVATGSGADANIIIENSKLWSSESPNLYNFIITLKDNDEIIDVHKITYGIRKISWSAKGIYINDKEVLLRGACIHHDNGILGAVSYPVSEERRIRILKEAGFNAIRMSHNPAVKSLLDACDKLGMYVMDESFDQWFMHKTKYDYASDFNNWFEDDLKMMVKKDYNHSCVIMYSIGNEISETCQKRGIELAESMKKTILSIDSTRPVTCSINGMLNAFAKLGIGGYKEKKEDKILEKNIQSQNNYKPKKEKASGSLFINRIMSLVGSCMNYTAKLKMVDSATRDAFEKLDICGYNYGSGRYTMDGKQYPQRIVVGSETFPPDLYDNWQKVKNLPYIIGDFMWTGWDYLGEAGLGCVCYDGLAGALAKYPYLLSGCGVIDITGYMRPEVYWNKIIWGQRKDPYISVEPLTHNYKKGNKSIWRKTDGVASWSWYNCENKEAYVTVYSNDPVVELFLNGVSIGRKTVKKCKANYKLKYQPGKLEVKSYNLKENLANKYSLVSAKEMLYINIEPEKSSLKSGGNDICYVNISLTDENGIVESAKDTALTIQIEGAGSLLGFGNANPITEEIYTDNVHSTFYGRAQAIIKSADDKGKIVVTVSANGYEQQQCILNCE